MVTAEAELARVDELARRLAASRRLMVLSGAGVSTDSGIPDYRDEAGQWKHRQPMRFQEFSRSLGARQRYWARSLAGFQRMDAARPNRAHLALAELESRVELDLLVTQNVDGLHQQAGSRNVLDLHGRLDLVECLGCRGELSRREFQAHLSDLNPSFRARPSFVKPDGDAELGALDTSKFLVPPCTRCGGILKPAVVFFGESVPAARVARSMAALAEAQALLIVGSSLMVFSGYRFAREAVRRDVPVLIVNRGKTRADEIATLKVSLPVGEVLPQLVEALGVRG
ncbi:MAG TPA: NAD-dependent protein deacetylase [Polyangiaceae bacterium]